MPQRQPRQDFTAENRVSAENDVLSASGVSEETAATGTVLPVNLRRDVPDILSGFIAFSLGLSLG